MTVVSAGILLGKFSDNWDVGSDPLPLGLERTSLAEEEDWAVVTVVEVAVDTAVPLLVVLLLALDFGVAARVLLLVIYT